MKKVLYLTLTLAGIMSLAACSSEEQLNVDGSANNVTFTAELPQSIASRAYSDGNSATKLSCYIYQKTDGGYTYITKADADVADHLASVSFNLMKGETYAAVFWAQAEDAPFSYDAATATMDMAYLTDGDNYANAENRDAFYYRLADFTVEGTISQSVALTRPFAQVNIGASDLAQAETAGYIYKTAKLTASTYTQLDLLTGESVGDITPVTFAEATFPSSLETPETFPITDDVDENGTAITYDYLAMDYLLLNNKQELIDVSVALTPADGSAVTNVKSFTFSNVPVQRNYRTNIYGTLFTEQVQYKVRIDQKFDDAYGVKIGSEKPEADEDGVFKIYTLSELVWVADQVNSGNFLSNYTFSLQNDIYMQGEWTPIGRDFGSRFGAKFLGNGHTIHNLRVKENERAGFFGFCNGQIEDLNFDNAQVEGIHWAGVVAGYSDNETGSMHITGCTVTNSSVKVEAEWLAGSEEWDNGDKAGGIIGYVASKDQIENCTVKNCTIQGYRDLGGIIGCSNGSVINNNSVSDVTIIVDNTHNYKNYTILGTGGNNANPVIGRDSGTSEGNTYENVTIKELGVD